MSDAECRRVRVVGRGRAGASFARALDAVGWVTELVEGHAASIRSSDVDLVLLCVPDAAVMEVGARVEPSGAVVAHVAGSLGLEVVSGHQLRAVLHPLASLPDATLGAARLRDGITFAVAGDPLARRVVADLGGVAVEVSDPQRVAYHAAAVIASNHLVALIDQVARVARSAGLAPDMYLPLISQTLDNVARLGAPAALTGPAARGDEATLDRHRALFAGDPFDERDVVAYDAMAALCRQLAERR